MFTPVGPPNNYAITSGNGTDCVTSAVVAYDASPTNAEGLGPQSITLIRTPLPFLQSNFAGTPGANLTTNVPTIGGAWTDINTNPMLLVTGGFVRAGGSGFEFLVSNAAAPPSADYSAKITLTELSAVGHAGVASRVIDASNFLRVEYNETSGAYELIQRITGGDTILGSFTHTISGAEVIEIITAGSNVSAKLNGTQIIAPVATALAAAGVVAVWAKNSLANDSTGLHMSSLEAT